MSQIEEEQKQEELRRAQAALLEKQEKNDKKKENEEFLDRLVINAKTVVIGFIRGIFFNRSFPSYLLSFFKRSPDANLSYEDEFDLHESEPVGGTHFHEWFCPKTSFVTEGKGNLEMDY